jgi:hypothetical protein
MEKIWMKLAVVDAVVCAAFVIATLAIVATLPCVVQ